MYKGNSSRVFSIILVLIVIAVAIAGLVSVGRAIFGGNQPDPAQVDVSQQALLNPSVSHSVRMTVRGTLVADENFRSYRITIDSSSRIMSTHSGYLGTSIDSKQYTNNTKAYEEFVHALDKANLALGTQLPSEKDDTRGICASGQVYEFEILENNRAVKRLWTSTCKGSAGSLKASVTQVEKLFLNQIPDQKNLLKNIDL